MFYKIINILFQYHMTIFKASYTVIFNHLRSQHEIYTAGS